MIIVYLFAIPTTPFPYYSLKGRRKGGKEGLKARTHKHKKRKVEQRHERKELNKERSKAKAEGTEHRKEEEEGTKGEK